MDQSHPICLIPPENTSWPAHYISKVQINRKCHFVCCITFFMWCLLISLTARTSRSADYSAVSDELKPVTFYYACHSSYEFLQWRAVLCYIGRHNYVNTSSLYKKSGNWKLRAVFKISSTRKSAVINIVLLIYTHVHCHYGSLAIYKVVQIWPGLICM